MRHRVARPVPPFDAVPTSVVDAAKLAFARYLQLFDARHLLRGLSTTVLDAVGRPPGGGGPRPT